MAEYHGMISFSSIRVTWRSVNHEAFSEAFIDACACLLLGQSSMAYLMFNEIATNHKTL